MYALSGKTLAGFQRLLERGADPNQQTSYNGDSGVSLAAQRKGSEALKIVLAHGGNPNLRRPGPTNPVTGGPAPIFDAMRSGNLENLRVLIKAGADLSTPTKGFEQTTPLLDAARLGAYDMMYLLLEAGADFRVTSAGGRTAIDEMFSERQHYERLDKRLTDEQARQHRQKCIEFLEKKGVDLTNQKQKWTEFERGKNADGRP